MTRKGLGVASIIVVAALLAIAIGVGNGLGTDAKLPVHWRLDGMPDRFASGWEALMMPVIITAAVSLLFYFLPSLEPRRKNLDRSQGLYLWAWAGLLLMGCAIQLVTVSAALGWTLAPHRIVTGALGFILMLIGNQLGKSRSTYMVGIRTPWTLASEEVWVKTHRLGGKLMTVAGLSIFISTVAGLAPRALGFIVAMTIAVATLVPVLYSFVLWRKEGRPDQPSQ